MRAIVSGLTVLLTASLAAQCDTEWLPGKGVRGVDFFVSASVLWDPDGSGPQSELWVIGGRFSIVGATLANHIATYDPATDTWGTLGQGFDREVLSLAVLPNNDLVAGGIFQHADGAPARGVARWNGSGWQPMGAGLDGSVRALAVRANGQLVAAGYLTGTGGVNLNNVAFWNGTSWFPGLHIQLGSVSCMQALPSGGLVFGGSFGYAGGNPVGNIAMWDGSHWSNLNGGCVGVVSDLEFMPNGDLVAAGNYTVTNSPGVRHLARWDGSQWTALGSTLPAGAMTVRSTGELIVSADGFQLPMGQHSGFVAFDGATWTAIGGPIELAATVAALPNGDLLAGGICEVVGEPANGIARWDGTQWRPLVREGFDRAPSTVTTLANGDLVVAGEFRVIDQTMARRIARWDGNQWSALAAGLDEPPWAMTSMGNGDLVVAGPFFDAGGQGIERLARWDGAAWSGMGLNWPYPYNFINNIMSLVTLPNGDLVVGGQFGFIGSSTASGIARWDGSQWSAVGNAPSYGFRALAVAPDETLHAAGWFQFSGGPTHAVARWDGSSWQPLGSLLGTVWSIGFLPTGEVVAGGTLQVGGSPHGVAVWNGTDWTAPGGGVPLTGNQTVNAVMAVPNGDLLVGGDFDSAGGVQARGAARWDGTDWSEVDLGTNGPIRAMTRRNGGSVTAVGSFTTAGDTTSAYLATLASSCPASIASSAPGCSGSAGLNELTALNLPFAGATLRARASGLTPTALALGVFGLQTTSLPLGQLTPLAGAGCTLAVATDIVRAYLPVGGSFETEVEIPNVAALAGIQAHQQVIAAELDAQGAITAVTATNSLSATIGAF